MALAPQDDAAVPFRTQGECVRYLAQGGAVVATTGIPVLPGQGRGCKASKQKAAKDASEQPQTKSCAPGKSERKARAQGRLSGRRNDGVGTVEYAPDVPTPTRCLVEADGCRGPVPADAPARALRGASRVAASDGRHRAYGVTDALPSPCRLCGSRLGVRYPSGWLCAVCEWRHGEVVDGELPPPRVDVVYYLALRRPREDRHDRQSAAALRGDLARRGARARARRPRR